MATSVKWSILQTRGRTESSLPFHQGTYNTCFPLSSRIRTWISDVFLQTLWMSYADVLSPGASHHCHSNGDWWRSRVADKLPQRHVTPAFIFVCSISLGLVVVAESFRLPTDVRPSSILSFFAVLQWLMPHCTGMSCHGFVWQGQQQKESVYLGAITHSI